MLIDWFTVAAQAVNFIVLVALLKHFLYRPILEALDAREQKIAAELAEAASQKTAAQKQFDEFQRKNAQFDQQRDELLNQALQAASAERQRLFAEARSAADSFQANYQAALQNDARNLNQTISRQTQQEVFAIVRQVLNDLASASFEEQLAELFVKRLQAMDCAAKAKLLSAISTSVDAAVVRSAFSLSTKQRATIQQVLESSVDRPVTLCFETAPMLISGIEVSVNGWKVVWSIADYLTELEKTVATLINQQNLAIAPASNAGKLH